MSTPFGGHPSLERLVTWLEEQGCTTNYEDLTLNGETYQALVICSPEGGQVVVPDPDLLEYLSPSMVSYFERRLGIKTPFASRPE